MSPRATPPLVCVTGASGAGKTTLIERLIGAFTRLGLRVAAVKHASHGFRMDHPGKDTWRMREAGAREIAVAGGDEIAFLADARLHGLAGPEPDPEEIAARFFRAADLVLAEGFRYSAAPRVVVLGGARAKPADTSGKVLAVVEAVGASAVSSESQSRASTGESPDPAPRFHAEDVDRLARFLARALGIPLRD